MAHDIKAHDAMTRGNSAVATKIGHGLAKVLRIKLNRSEPGEDVTRGESVFSVTTADTFVEEEPSSAAWLRGLLPDSEGIKQYFTSLFPFLKWITRYNSTWFMGDTVAGESPLLLSSRG